MKNQNLENKEKLRLHVYSFIIQKSISVKIIKKSSKLNILEFYKCINRHIGCILKLFLHDCIFIFTQKSLDGGIGRRAAFRVQS